MSGAITDLFVLLSVKDAGLIAKFGEAGIMGERMAVKVAAAMKTVEVSMAKTAEATNMVVAAGHRMAVSWERDLAAMTAATAAHSAAFASQQRITAASMAQLEGAEKRAAASSTGLAAAIGISNNALMGVGAVAAFAGWETAKMAGDFHMATQRLVSSAGEVEENLDMIREGLIGMAGEVGYSVMHLADALYTVESGGQRGAAGLETLRAAAQGAKAENAELGTVADALTSVLVDYHMGADQAALAMSKLVATGSQGKMTLQDLASSLSAVLPVASANKIALDDVLGSLASMTVHGMSARQAAQNLTDAIRHMAAPTMMQSKQLAMLGINSQDLSTKLSEVGLSGTINMIGDRIRQHMGPGASKVVLDLHTALKTLPPAVQELGAKVLDGSVSMGEFTKSAKGLDVIAAKQVMSFAALAGSTHTIGTEQKSGAQITQSYAGAMAKAMGDATGLNVALMIGGQNAHITAEAIRVISGATTEAGNNVKGWAGIQDEFNQKLDRSKSAFGALGISIGEKLLPVLTPLVGAIADVAHWLSENDTAATALAVVLGGAVVLGFSAAAAAAWTFTAAMWANPLTWIIAAVVVAVAALAYAVYKIYENWGAIKGFFSGIWNAIKGFFTDGARWVGDKLGAIGRFASELPGKVWEGLSKLGQIAKDAWNRFVQACEEAGPRVLKFFQDLPYNAGYALGALIGILLKLGWDGLTALSDGSIAAAEAFWNWLRGVPGWVWDILSKLPGQLWDLAVWAWNGFTDGVLRTAERFWNWLRGVPGWVWGVLSALPGQLWNAGTWAWNSFTDSVLSTAERFWGWLRGVPGWVLDSLGNLGNLLWNAGKSIIDGLLAGIKAGYQSMINFVSGIGDGIAAHKGPIDYDRVLLTPQGKAIMDGLLVGLRQGHGRVREFVKSIAGGLQGDLGGGGLNLNMSGHAGLGATAGRGLEMARQAIGGDGGLRLSVNVAGHVWTTQDLVKEIQAQLLRHGIRNNNAGINYVFSR